MDILKSREFKFRVWEKRSKCFVDNPTKYQRMAIGCDGGVYHGGYDSVRYEDYIIQQYTGMKDEKGKEIYEGDIIETRYSTVGEVVWYDERYSCEYTRGGIGTCAGFILREGRREYRNINTARRVIGNVFENPEFLNTKE